MRIWERAQRVLLCGKCGQHIAVGAAVLLMKFPTVARVLTRCENCEGPAPPDLPAPPPTDAPGGRSTKPLSALAKSAEHWLAKPENKKHAR